MKPRIIHDYTSNMKICSKCNEEKPRTKEYFNTHTGTPDDLNYVCKTCKKVIDKESRQKNIVKFKAYQKSPEFVYSQLKHQAKKRDMPFELTLKYYLENLVHKKCFYCGSTNTKHWVDRYINDHSMGYTINNSVACCELCNKMKSAHTPKVFLDHCKKVSDYNN